MSLTHDSYLPPELNTAGPTAMNLNNMLQAGQSYDRYPQLEEGSQPAEQGPPIQLPPQQAAIELEGRSSSYEGRLYSLEIVQQPVRARMCGFGDKDRRPITPPPCIKLIVKDAQTLQKIDVSEIDTSYFVLSVDLWSSDGGKEVNLVRHSATSPSISAATAASYPPNAAPIPAYHQGAGPQYGGELYQQSPLSPQNYQSMGMANLGLQGNVYGSTYGGNSFPKQTELAHYQQVYKQQDLQQQQQSLHHHHLPSSQTQASVPSAQPMSEQVRGYYNPAPPTPSASSQQMGYYQSQGPLLSPEHVPNSDPRAQPGGMFTRNLIGSLCVSAFKLADPGNETGVWFVLQDLSVRTEGTFRLKMNFVNVGQTSSSAPATPSSQNFAPGASSGGGNGGSAAAPFNVGKLNTGAAPVLASCFSDRFEVFSAKKFPGVIESTKLSKCFATQGIKIPIRKDGFRGNERGREEDDE